MEQRDAISELICQSCMTLDDKNFGAYLDLCDPGYRYAITAYSPEIRKEMTWLEHDKEGMKTLFGNLPKHNSDQSPLNRHVTVYTVKHNEDGSEADVVSALQVYRTSLDGGTTELFAIGKFRDRVSLRGGTPKLLDRNVRLDTRMLGYGYHIPF